MSMLAATFASVIDSLTLAFRPDLSLQTTTVALALTSSVICSSIFLIISLLNNIRHGATEADSTVRKTDRTKRQNSQSNLKRNTQSHEPNQCMHAVPGGQKTLRHFHKPKTCCLRCDKIEPDVLCDRNLCHHCCHSDQVICTFHSNTYQDSIHSRARQIIDLRGENLTCCPERIGYSGHQVTGLVLSCNLLTRLPDEIGCLQGLTILDLSNNRLRELPDCLGNLNKLRCLHLSHNQLCVLPLSCDRLHNLQVLQLDHNKVAVLPEVVTRLCTLQELDISNNALKLLPEALCNLRNLLELTVSNNPLKCMPTKLNQLVHLQLLDVSECQLSELPAALTSCLSLTRLNVCCNKLRWLPTGLSCLPKLRDILVHDNLLTYLPMSMYQWLTDNKNFSAYNNPFLTKNERNTFQSSPTVCLNPGIPLVPSLQEWCAKTIVSQKVHWETSNLPTTLKNTLSRLHYCHYCGLPVFDFYHCHVEYRPLGQHASIPFCHIVCTHHAVTQVSL